MPRRRALNAAKREDACRLVEIGITLRAAAAHVKCSPRTLRREMARDEDFRLQMNDARQAASQNPWAREQRAARRRLRGHSAATPYGVNSSLEADVPRLEADISATTADNFRRWFIRTLAARMMHYSALQAAERKAS